MADKPLAVGDTVRLKSGGPKMTVIMVSTEYAQFSGPGATCQWFEQGGAVKKHDFPTAALEHDEGADSGWGVA